MVTDVHHRATCGGLLGSTKQNFFVFYRGNTYCLIYYVCFLDELSRSSVLKYQRRYIIPAIVSEGRIMMMMASMRDDQHESEKANENSIISRYAQYMAAYILEAPQAMLFHPNR